MTLNIELAFPTNICINCDVRPIRKGGIARCQICADQKEAIRMDKEKEYELTANDRLIMSMKGPWNVDESHPDIKDYIEYNASDEGLLILQCCGNSILLSDINHDMGELFTYCMFSKENGLVHKTTAGCYGEENEENEKDLVDEYRWPTNPENA